MQLKRKPLRLERLETRQLPSNVVHIDSSWVKRAGSEPILLDQADTLYLLDTAVDMPGTAFVVGAADVTLDLQNHRVVYGDRPSPVVVNGSFEDGGPGNSVPGWDLSAAPSAARVPAIPGLFGDWMLKLSSITGTETILSDPVAIPAANREYEASITPKGPYGTTVRLSVVDAVTDAVVASGTSRDPERGFAALAVFTPATTHAVRLRVEVSPPSGQPASVDLDYAALLASRDYGVMATQAWSGDLPPQLQAPEILAVYRAAARFELRGGSVTQGQGRGAASSPLFFNGLPGFTVDNVTTFADGMDTCNLDATWGRDGVVAGSTFQGAVDRISDRMNLVAALNFDNFDGSLAVADNHILDVPQIGVLVSGMPNEQSVRITGNDIRQSALVTDAYGITFGGVQNFEIADNVIDPANGRGILFDGWGRIPTQNGTVHDNYVAAIERPDLEYGDRLEVTALRLRNWDQTQRNLTITHNSFVARTGPGGVYMAQGARITEYNYSGQCTGADNLIADNLFQAVVTTTDAYFTARALSVSNVGAGTGLQINDNVLESNDIALNLGDNDSWQGHDDDITLRGNTLSRTTDGANRPFTSIRAGDYETEVSRIRMPETYLINGAPPAVVIAGPFVTPFKVGWVQGDASRAEGSGATEAAARVSVSRHSTPVPGQPVTGTMSVGPSTETNDGTPAAAQGQSAGLVDPWAVFPTPGQDNSSPVT